MRRVSVLARHLNAAPASSVAVTVDIDAVVTAPGDEAPRLIELAQLAKSGEISLEELREASLQVLGVAEAPTVDHSAVTGSEYFELDSDAGQSLLDACTSDRQSESDDRHTHTRIRAQAQRSEDDSVCASSAAPPPRLNPLFGSCVGAVADLIASKFQKQETDTSCGIVSTGTALLATGAAVAEGLPSPQMRDIFTLPATTQVMPMQEVIDQGTTIDQVTMIMEKNNGGHVEKHFADQIAGVDGFRKIVCDALDKGLATPSAAASVVVINYDMDTLAKVTGSEAYLVGLPNPEHVDSGLGHMSVLSAYHAETDRFLLLDTWPGTPSGWATTADLYAAVCAPVRASTRLRHHPLCRSAAICWFEHLCGDL